ncbi:hypothetical protein [Dietzia cinnamea]|uniref:hypothetical protein n=1 Tax=Dietzia cinnamea TaxID=321318 RepID=UPI0021A389BF|nr:hypothetical protein [Dietzia cinnamea]MCT2140166.1 hypothetical protein [Dietzia cinnamea]
MSDELEEALAPVKQHFRGKKISENTVLAAYMRAAKLEPTGPKWQAAKAAFKGGATFSQAVAAVAESKSSAAPQAAGAPQAVPTKSPREPVPSLRPRSSTEQVSPSYKTTKEVSQVGAKPDPIARTPRKVFRTPTGDDERNSMKWFPKRFAPGDIHGQGAEKLLGRPDLQQLEVLVRETAQNSWDARGTADHIDFCINLRRLSNNNLTALRRDVFGEAGGPEGLQEILTRDEVWAIEISDRGTIGLGGPTRNDLEPASGVPTNFIDFVFDLGAPKSQGMSGGTYGYGKTVSYSSSSVGTVLIWSRCANNGQLEDRLIGSAIGPSFNMGGRRYTGRHWWGRIPENGDRVEPLIGAEAERIAADVFSSGFERSATGTSILILDPHFGDDDDSRPSQARSIAEVVENHLWPKLIDSDLLRARMNITILLDGEPIPIGDQASHKIRANYGECLNMVRRIQSGGSTDSDNVRAFPITRYNDVVGHLCMTRFPIDKRSGQGVEHEDPGPKRLAENRVALMRNEAELVVKYLDFPALAVEGFAWVGVFKPVSATDGAFAAAEPPAHDEWNPATVTVKTQKSIVNVALRKVKEAVASYLAPTKSLGEVGVQPPAAQIGDFLAGLLVGLDGPAPTKRRNGTIPSTPKKSKAKVSISGVRTDPIPGSEWNTSIVTVQMRANDSQSRSVSMVLSIGTEGNSREPINRVVLRNNGWLLDSGIVADQNMQMKDGDTAFYAFDSSAKVAIDLQPRIETP